MRSTRTPARRRPAVAGIRRPAGRPSTGPQADTRPADDPATADADAPDEPVVAEAADEVATPSRRALVAPVALLLAAALLVAGGVWALARAEAAGQANTALVDAGGTAEVTRQVREGLEQIFSYRHDATAATENAARTVLTGPARDQYERLFHQVREQAPAQRLTLTTKVVSSGVVTLRGDEAVLLVFLDQSAVRGDSGEATAAGAQLSVTATRVDGRWLISELVPR
ncbi:hypothetical protein ACFPM7_20290 [Actinokineospora guangxiensis]|uniref:Mce-associated membrane protein n=1 Tax=Actinokineospora guangxiensis TaxID=1490288 RepID=A0ABW0EPQ3_9PSEU